MSIEKLKEKYISAQWLDFVQQAIVQIDLAREIYCKNKDSERHRNGRRKAIAPIENTHASISIILLNSAIEGLCNAQAFWAKQKNFNQWDSLSNKLKKIIPNIDNNLLNALLEFDFIRNTIVHGYIWIKLRRYKKDFSFKYVKSYLWRPFKNNKNFKNLVNWTERRTKNYKFSIIPTEINFVDALMGLSITSKITGFFGWNNHIKIHNLKRIGFSEQTSAISLKDSPDNLLDWLEYFKGFLSNYDKKILENLLKNIRF